MQYTFRVKDRNYESWELYEEKNEEIDNKINNELEINPIQSKLFNNDIFTIKNDEVNITHSTTRKAKLIAGVLVLKNNKTFGKFKNKFLYRCIPNDTSLPGFLLPYRPRIKFLKNQVNKYIVFRFTNWNNKHPRGQIQQTIGDVTELSNYYEYQIYCKNLYNSIANFKKKTKEKLKKHDEDFYMKLIMDKYTIDNRTSWNEIVTIDSLDAKDLDDAIGYKQINTTECLISVYITNITFWMDILDIWDSFSKRISTIYLPDRKLTMLPLSLADDICSLLENKKRIAFTLDIIVNEETGEIKEYSFKNTLIKVEYNLRHKTNALYSNKTYKVLSKLCKKMNKKNVYLKSCENGPACETSSEVVAYYMVLMNYLSALKLTEFKTGIFRVTKENKEYVEPKETTTEQKSFLKIWNSSGGVYCKYNNVLHDNLRHEMLNLEAYVHITSPNRRFVDMLNMMIIQDKLNLMKFNEKSKSFYDNWMDSLDYINESMKNIRKIQNDCALLHLCNTNKELTKKKLNGFVFDKIQRNDELYQYLVYIPEIKMINRIITMDDLKNLSEYQFKIYIFMDEIKLKQKIRIVLVA